MPSSLPFDLSSETPQMPAPDRRRRNGLGARPGGFRFWVLPPVLLVLVGLVVVSLVLAPSDARPTITGISETISLLLALGCSVWASFRVPRGRVRWAWRCIALALASYIIASILAVTLQVSENTAPTTSVADAFFLPFYPILALGAILLPAVQSTSAKQVRVLLDVCIAIGALVGLGLVFLIAPRYSSGTPVDYVFIAYPVADLAVLLVLVVLLARGVPSTSRPSFFWLMVGMLCFIYADSAFNYLTLPNLSNGPTYYPGTAYVDPFWVAGALAFSLAALRLVLRAGSPGPTRGWLVRPLAWLRALRPSGLLAQFCLLAVPVVVLFGLIVFTELSPQRAGTVAPLAILTLLVVLLIITRQLLTMRDLVDARIATERAEQLDTLKDQFITSVNHELRTPMMTMQGYIELLSELQDRAEPTKRAEMLERARRANAALVHLLQSILDTRRIDQEAENFVSEAINVYETVQAAITLIDPREGNLADRKLVVAVPSNLVIWGESVRMQQIVTNLVSNAVKYSPPGTVITVEAKAMTEKGPRLRGWSRSGGQGRLMVEIMVRDQGLGIPPEQIPLLFRRFVRLPRDLASRVRGTGLGLYLCRVFTEAMGGTIWVESSGIAGEGSTFYVRLPMPPERVPSLLLEPLAPVRTKSQQ